MMSNCQTRNPTQYQHQHHGTYTKWRLSMPQLHYACIQIITKRLISINLKIYFLHMTIVHHHHHNINKFHYRYRYHHPDINKLRMNVPMTTVNSLCSDLYLCEECQLIRTTHPISSNKEIHMLIILISPTLPLLLCSPLQLPNTTMRIITTAIINNT